MRRYFWLGILVFCMYSCGSESGHEAVNIFSLKEIPQPELFGEGAINTEDSEFSFTISSDGKEAFFNKSGEDRAITHLVSTQFIDGQWSKPKPLPFSDGTYSDMTPFLTEDGQRLYFSSNRPIEGDSVKDFDIWYIQREGDAWSAPINLGAPINSEKNEVYVSLTTSGDLFFTIFEESGDAWIYESKWENGKFGTPQRVPLPVDPTARITNPAVAPDGSYLIFATPHLIGQGGVDLHIAYADTHGHWLVTVNLGDKVNSYFADYAPSISPDGKKLFFTSERPGIVPQDSVVGRPPSDIYEVVLPVKDIE